MRSEFERTPKTGTTVAAGGGWAGHGTGDHRRAHAPKRRWPYVLAEAFYVNYQLAWAMLFVRHRLVVCAAGAACMAGCVIYTHSGHSEHHATQRRRSARREHAQRENADGTERRSLAATTSRRGRRGKLIGATGHSR